MSTPAPLEIFRASGSHRECGVQVGEFWAELINREVDFSSSQMQGRTESEQLALAAAYRDVTVGEFPWVVEEIDGMAEGANVDALALFAVTIEEIWGEAATTLGRCSDLVAGPPSTRDGRFLVAHNNDLDAKDEDELLAVSWSVPGEPETFTLGGPPWLSAGFNAAGLAFTGNELTPNDEVIGIPRQLQFRAMLPETTMEGAVAVALHPRRASSYNNIVTDAGGVTNVEASATDAEVTMAEHGGVLAHTNHYTCDRMLVREGDPAYAKRSAVRLQRARELLAAAPLGTVDEAALRVMLSDHENAPDALCRHPVGDDSAKTVFWCIADPGDHHVTFGRGNPCDSQAQQFRFA